MIAMHANISLTLTAILWVFILTVLPVIAVIIYRLHLHPLSRIPGPKLAAISNIWQARYVRGGRVRHLALTLHQQYGPLVRVGPNEIWVCDGVEGVKQVYGAVNGWEKSEFYWATALNKPVGWSWDWREGVKLEWPDTLDLLSEFDGRRYRMQRRVIGPVYSASNVKRYEKGVEDVVGRAVEELKRIEGESVDLKMWMHILAVECLGEVVLGWSPGYIKTRSDGGTSGQSYAGWKRKSVFGLFPEITALGFWSKEVSRLWADLWGVTFVTPKGFKPFFTPVYQKSSKRITGALREAQEPRTKSGGNMKGKQKGNAKTAAERPRVPDLLIDLIKLHQSRPDEFTENYLRRMAVTNFGAGHETLCSTLTAVVAMIASHPEVHRRVCTEVRAVKDLSYTKAAIKEAQRLWPVIGMSLARRVPAGGKGEFVAGCHVPPGTTVGCNPVALHRDEAIFGAETEKYIPERWLKSGAEEDEERLRVMERYNLIYGGGARTCPGKSLAEMVVLKVVTGLFKELDIEIAVMPEDGEMPCYFMAMMSGVTVRFRQIGTEISNTETIR
ncbi:Pisatin demethylase [Cladorrhinum sp. PSN259]|nr:Pisatin demethylase [Cladorrhinum sp. PSN259]